MESMLLVCSTLLGLLLQKEIIKGKNREKTIETVFFGIFFFLNFAGTRRAGVSFGTNGLLSFGANMYTQLVARRSEDFALQLPTGGFLQRFRAPASF
jgi:hypothetical protein